MSPNFVVRWNHIPLTFSLRIYIYIELNLGCKHWIDYDNVRTVSFWRAHNALIFKIITVAIKQQKCSKSLVSGNAVSEFGVGIKG